MGRWQLGLVGAAAVVVLGFVGLLVVAGQQGPGPADTRPAASGVEVVREDSHVIGERGSSDVEVVEFLDFECEGCAAAYPLVERLREEYAGEVTFVARYFPMPGHPNSRTAAHAVEAAARQGQLEAMYQRLFETQTAWSHTQADQSPVFRGYAEDLGLDLEQFDADVASDDVAARVQSDVDDGLALGVRGTPTFYIDDEPFVPTAVEDFATTIDDALGR